MVRQQEPVVTGDAVVLDVQIAQLPVRALSAMIDIIVVFIAYTIGVLLWASTLTQFDTAFSAAVLIIFTVLALVGYPIAFETATRGRSLGQDGAGAAGGVGGRRSGTLPPSTVSCAGGRDRDLDIRRRPSGDL